MQYSRVPPQLRDVDDEIPATDVAFCEALEYGTQYVYIDREWSVIVYPPSLNHNYIITIYQCDQNQ